MWLIADRPARVVVLQAVVLQALLSCKLCRRASLGLQHTKFFLLCTSTV
jgi:hypothetical protein